MLARDPVEAIGIVRVASMPGLPDPGDVPVRGEELLQGPLVLTPGRAFSGLSVLVSRGRGESLFPLRPSRAPIVRPPHALAEPLGLPPTSERVMQGAAVAARAGAGRLRFPRSRESS